jgi:hypothetical protein
MKHPIRRHGSVLLLLLVLAWPVPGQAETPTLEGEALVAALRDGGFNLYFRHEATDWSQTDLVQQRGDWTSCDPSRIRQLSTAGRASATRTGEAMRALAIPVGKVYSSPYCRAVQTAEALGLGSVETTSDVMNLRVADYFGGRAAIVATARGRLSGKPAPGRNDVYVAHGNVAREATSVYPGEGEALVFRPHGDAGFEFVGRLPPDAWLRLADMAGIAR